MKGVTVWIVESTEKRGNHFFLVSPEGQTESDVLRLHAEHGGEDPKLLRIIARIEVTREMFEVLGITRVTPEVCSGIVKLCSAAWSACFENMRNPTSMEGTN